MVARRYFRIRVKHDLRLSESEGELEKDIAIGHCCSIVLLLKYAQRYRMTNVSDAIPHGLAWEFIGTEVREQARFWLRMDTRLEKSEPLDGEGQELSSSSLTRTSFGNIRSLVNRPEARVPRLI